MIRLDAKYTVENCSSIDIRELKKWGCLDDGFTSGTIVSENKYGDKQNSLGIMVNTDLEFDTEKYVRLMYSVIDIYGNNQPYDYKIPLSTTRCRFGGERYWFRCYMNLRGIACGRRVAVMYKGAHSDIFACRHCHNLSYYSKNQNRRNKYFPLIEAARINRLIGKLRPDMKRTFYDGQLTKKAQRILQLQRKANAYHALLNPVDFI